MPGFRCSCFWEFLGAERLIPHRGSVGLGLGLDLARDLGIRLLQQENQHWAMQRQLSASRRRATGRSGFQNLPCSRRSSLIPSIFESMGGEAQEAWVERAVPRRERGRKQELARSAPLGLTRCWTVDSGQRPADRASRHSPNTQGQEGLPV